MGIVAYMAIGGVVWLISRNPWSGLFWPVVVCTWTFVAVVLGPFMLWGAILGLRDRAAAKK
jgi:hypothetical protein